MVKSPNWQEATIWLFTKRESGTTGNKSKPEVRTEFEPRAAAWKPNDGSSIIRDNKCERKGILLKVFSRPSG